MKIKVYRPEEEFDKAVDDCKKLISKIITDYYKNDDYFYHEHWICGSFAGGIAWREIKFNKQFKIFKIIKFKFSVTIAEFYIRKYVTNEKFLKCIFNKKTNFEEIEKFFKELPDNFVDTKIELVKGYC